MHKKDFKALKSVKRCWKPQALSTVKQQPSSGGGVDVWKFVKVQCLSSDRQVYFKGMKVEENIIFIFQNRYKYLIFRMRSWKYCRIVYRSKYSFYELKFSRILWLLMRSNFKYRLRFLIYWNICLRLVFGLILIEL